MPGAQFGVWALLTYSTQASRILSIVFFNNSGSLKNGQNRSMRKTQERG